MMNIATLCSDRSEKLSARMSPTPRMSGHEYECAFFLLSVLRICVRLILIGSAN